MGDSPDHTRLVLQARLSASVIEGTLVDPSGAPHEFHGWLALYTALEAALSERPSGAEDNPASRDPRQRPPAEHPRPLLREASGSGQTILATGEHDPSGARATRPRDSNDDPPPRSKPRPKGGHRADIRAEISGLSRCEQATDGISSGQRHQPHHHTGGM
jgi:hypothetical protein